MTLFAQWNGNELKEEEEEEIEIRKTFCNNYNDVETQCNFSGCNDELCVFYQQVWKELFLEETGFTEDYFSKHVFVCFTGIAAIIQPGSAYRRVFEIQYQVRVGWAMVSHTDFFVIQHGDEPYLTKEDIKNKRIPFNYHEEITNHEIFKFASLECAMTHLKKQARVDNLCVSFVHYASGSFFLQANAFFVDDPDHSISTYLNLITGETSISYSHVDVFP